MDVWTTLENQKAVRRFDGRLLDRAHLERIAAAGRNAPSSMNLQRWSFVVCRDREMLGRLAGFGAFAGHLAGAGAAVALVTPRTHDADERESIAFDLGQVAQSMMLAAWELGVGSVHAAIYDEPRTRELLGYPPDRRCDYVLSFGYPEDPAVLDRPKRRSARRPLDRIVHHERW